MPSVLLIIIGNSELQLVYDRNRADLPKDTIGVFGGQLDQIPFKWDDSSIEVKTPGYNISDAEAIVLPKLKKAIDDLISRGETQLDELILIATNRSKGIDQLDQLLAENPDIIMDAEICREVKNIKEQALHDNSLLYAAKMKSLLENNAYQIPMQISKISILSLGTGSYYDRLPMIGKPLRLSDLDRFDLNKNDFWEYELVEALKPKLEMFGLSKLYIRSWGGMPNLRASLDRVLEALLVNPGIIRLFSSHSSGYIRSQNTQDEFLNLHKSMNRSAVEMDWSSVAMLFAEIRSLNPGYFSEPVEKEMRELLAEINGNQENEKNWFGNFFVLIMRAVYNQDMNLLFIWLRCLVEAAFLAILELPENFEAHSYRLIRDTQLNKHIINAKGKGSVLILKDGTQIEAKYSELLASLEDIGSVKHLNEYGKLLYLDSHITHKQGYRHKTRPVYQALVNHRNALVHSGIPIPDDPQLLHAVFSFIGIDKDRISSLILSAKECDWQALMFYERELLNTSPFFSLMKAIGTGGDSDWLPLERSGLERYIHIISKT